MRAQHPVLDRIVVRRVKTKCGLVKRGHELERPSPDLPHQNSQSDVLASWDQCNDGILREQEGVEIVYIFHEDSTK
jgi:hypothetical protein